MKLESETPLGDLLAAIPSASHVLRQLGVRLDGNERKTMGELCREYGIAFDDFLRAMDQLDWEQEAQ